MTKHTANYIQDRAEHTGRLLRLITLGISFLLLSGLALNLNAQCPTPTNDATMATTGTGANPAHTLAPISYPGTATAGADETLMLVYMNTVNQFDIPSEITAADLPSPTVYASTVAYNGKGQQLMAYWDVAVSRFFVANNLKPSTTYYFYTVQVARCGTEYAINSDVATANVMARTTSAGLLETYKAHDVVFGTIGDTNIPINSFTGITQPTTPTGYVIKMNTTNSFTPVTDGTDPATLGADPAYAGGEQVVYAGTSTSPNIDITGLTIDTQYFFKIYAYYNNYYQQTGYTFIQSTTTSKAVGTIAFRNNTFDGMSINTTDASVALETSFSYPDLLLYQILEAPYGTTIGSSVSQGWTGSVLNQYASLVPNHSGNVLVEITAIGGAGNGSEWTTSKQQFTISLDKVDPTMSLENLIVEEGSTHTLSNPSNSDGLFTYSIEGTANGNSLSGSYNKTLTVGTANTITTLRATVAESDRYLAATKDVYISAKEAAVYYFTSATKLIKYTGGTATTLVNFLANSTATGITPSGIALINGKIWGTTTEGGVNGKGVLYMVDTDGSNFTKITDFSSTNSSAQPTGLAELDGKVWGITLYEGTNSQGSLYRVNLDGTGYQVMHSFDGTDLQFPGRRPAFYNGKIYGGSFLDVTNSRGAIFSINTDGTGYTLDHSVDANHTNPYYGMTSFDSKLWTSNGSNAIYAYDPVTKTMAHKISASLGAFLTTEGDGTLYGLSSSQIFKVNASNTSTETVHTFSSANDIQSPAGELYFDGGNLVGLALDAGGTNGVLYSILPDGTGLTQIYKSSTGETFTGQPIAGNSKLTPTITFANQTVDHLSITNLAATSNSTSSITYELISDVTGSSLNGSEFTAGNVGTVTIRASVASNGNFEAATQDATFTIQKVAPTITLADITKEYGDANFQVAAITNSTGAVTYAFTTSNTGSSVVGAGDEIQLGTTLGTDNLQVSVAGDANFLAGTLDVNVTIGKRMLTVTADAQSRPYGDANPALTYTVTNFAFSEDESVINSLPSTPTTTVVQTDSPGSFPITLVQDGSDDFYDFNYVDGTLTVNKAVLTLTATDVTYVVRNIPGGYFNTPNVGFTITGYKLGQDINDLNSNSIMVFASVSNGSDLPGTTDIIPYNDVVETNYTFNKVNGTLTKSPIPVTATATNTTIGYNDPIPTFAFTYSSAYSFQDWTIDTPPTFNTTAVQGDPLGTYPITGSGGVDDLYEFSYVDGTLTIAKKDQTLAFEPFGLVQVGDAAIALSANTQQGLPVTYSSSNTAVATISGNAVNIVGAGEAIISASAAGDANNNALISGVSRKLSVFNNPTVANKITTVSTDGVAQVDASNVLSYLYAFDAGSNEALGTNPTGAPFVTGKKIWGTTTQGGSTSSGVIFRMNHDGTGYEVVHSFNDTDNAYDAVGSLIEVGDKIYGMTEYGGDNDSGVIFRIDTTGSNFTIIHQFNGSDDNNGDNPANGLFYSGGKLWGTTGNANSNNGIVFNLDVDGSNFTVIHGFDFVGGDASDPIGGLVEANGRLWGTTERGGTNNGGAIYSVGLDGVGYQVDVELSANSYPDGALTPVGDKLYGLAGGNSFTGTERGYIFSIDNTGQNFTLLHDFTDGTSANGIYPTGSLTLIEGELWGVTENGGANSRGVVFKYNPDTDVFTNVVDLDNSHSFPWRTTVLPIYESAGGAIAAEDITFNAPASLEYDNTNKTYTITPNPSLVPSIAASEFDLTYEGRDGTTYASSTTAPVDAGDYTVVATIKATNMDYSGAVKENFTIAPFATSIVLNLPGSGIPYNGSPQGITPTANDIAGSPTLALVTEYSVSGAGSYSTTVPTDAGMYDVRVNLDASETNYSAVEATGSFTIDPVSQVITFNAIPEVACGQIQIDLTLYTSSNTGNTLTFASSNTAVATITDGIATIVGDGTTTITASQAGSGNVGAAVDVTQDLTVSATQENYSVDNPADEYVCDASSYILPALTEGDYYTEAGGTGSMLSAGTSINATTTLYVYGVSAVNATCTDENSFTITIAPLPVDDLPDVTVTGFYTLPSLTNGNYFTGTGGTGSALNAGDQITTSQTIYIYAEDGGTCSSETSFVVTVTPNPALHFDQAGSTTTYDYLSVADDNSLDVNEFTFEAWVNFDQLNTVGAGVDWRAIFNKSRYNDSYGLMVYAPSKLMRFYHAGVGAGYTDYTWSGLTAGAWHHIAVKWDATAQKTSILIDGIEAASNTSVTGTLPTNTEPLLIGASRNVASDPYPFDGIMDEIRVWNYARTDTEISDYKDIKLQGSESGLVLYYDFSEGTIDGNNTGLSVVPDQSSVGNDATFNNFALSGSASNYVNGSGNGVQEGISQTITFNALSNVTFGDAGFSLSATASSGLDVTYASSNTSVATVSGNTVTIVGAGTTTITASQVGDATYLPAGDVDQTLTVDPFATSISLNLPGTNPAYDGSAQAISPSANDISSNPTLALVTEYSVSGMNSFSTTVPVDAGTYDVRANLDGETNYSASEATGSYTIDQVALSITADNRTITYGDNANTGNTVTYGGFVNSETAADLSGTLAFASISQTDAGSYTGAIVPSGLTSSNYNISFVAGNLTINQRAITVTADAKSKTYGDADPALSYQVTTGALQYSDAFTGALSRATGENVGTYAINQNTLDAGSNYVLTYVSDDLTIGTRAIEITADAKSKTYGDADPALTYQITSGALQFSDVVSGSLSRATGENAGDYAINQNTLDIGSNYSLTYVSDNLTIGTRALEITADAKSKTYGNADPALTYQVTSGALQFSDAISGALSRATGEDIGTYAITQGTLSAGSNYTITFVSDDLTITVRSIFVRAETANKVYGDADPSFTPVIASGTLAFSDTFTGSLTRDAGEDVAAYTIRQGTLSLGSNYSITFLTTGSLNITARPLTITADAKSKTYGDADPALTYQLTSGTLQGMDVLSGALSRDAGEDAGTYAINQGTVTAGSNYLINYVSDDLTVNTRALEITADAKIKTYGNADPSLTYQITSGALQGGDVLTGALSRDAGEDAGAYSINQGTLSAGSNYDVTYVSDNLTIGTAAIEVTADAQAKTYGDADPTLSYTVTSGSLQFSDTFSGALTRNSGESIGTYAINQGSLTAGSNYVLSYVSDDLTISTRAIEITADDQSKTVGGSDPALTYTITNGALQFSDVVSGSLTRTSGETVGDYPITQGTLDLGSNYNLTFVPGTLTITSKLTQTITFGPLAAVTFGDANFDLSATGGASGNPVTFVSSNTAVATISGNTVTIVGGGTTNITASQLGDATYEDAADVVQSLTVNKASQSITVTTATSMNLIDNSSIVLSATGGGSGNPVTFSLFPGTDATIAADGVTLTPNSAGLINVNVNQAGDDNYESAFTIFSLSVMELYVWDGLAWNSVSTPPTGSDILFAGNYTLSGSFEVESATVQTGATVTIPDGSVFISNTEMNSIDGSVVVESGGSLVTYGDVFGANYTIERTTTFDQSTGRYSIVGSPIQNANFSVLGSSALVYGYDQSELYNPTGNAGLDRFKTPTTLGITEMAVGKGYFSAFTGDANGQINFVGTPNTDDINVTLDFTDHAASEETDFEGFNLISNPYPSAISYSSFITGNSAADINGSIYLWDDFDSQNSRGDNSDYLIVNTLGNTDSRSNGEAKWDGNIRSGQGFFVKANSATSVSFTNSMRVTGNNTDGGFFRVDESEIQSLKLRLSNGNSTKAIVIGFAPDATLDMDSQYDAMSWSGNDYAFYSLSGTKQLAIQGLPQFYTGEIALGLYASEEGQQTISLMDVKNQEGIDVVFLKDKLTGEVINLREQSYTFIVSAGETNDRFVLQAFPNNVTGVEESLEQQIFSYSDYGNLYVVFKTNDIKEANFTMFDLSGRILLNQNSEINANRWQVATDKIPANIYILMIKTEKGIWKQKVKVE